MLKKVKNLSRATPKNNQHSLCLCHCCWEGKWKTETERESRSPETQASEGPGSSSRGTRRRRTQTTTTMRRSTWVGPSRSGCWAETTRTAGTARTSRARRRNLAAAAVLLLLRIERRVSRLGRRPWATGAGRWWWWSCFECWERNGGKQRNFDFPKVPFSGFCVKAVKFV